MAVIISVERDGAARARTGLELCVAAGGVAVFPADGLYGIACDPLNASAIDRVHQIKGRDDGKPAAVLHFSPPAMRELVEELGARTAAALAALLPGPVTAVVANRGHRYPLACRDDPDRLGVRLIDGPLAGAMCPVFQTSANLSGQPAPAIFADVPREILTAADVAIDGGALTGLPSTVVDLSDFERSGEWAVLREGGMAVEDLARRLEAV